MQGELFGHSLTRKTAKIRCPGCLKPYAVSRDQIQTDKPRFECKACQQQFWVQSPDCFFVEDVIGFPIQDPNSALKHKAVSPAKVEDPTLAAKIFTCPKCTEPYSAGQTECTKCGLVFRKFENSFQGTNTARTTPELKKAWEDLIINYHDLTRHLRFLEAAERAGCLEYAAERYQRVSEAAPDDEMAQDMLKDIEARAQKDLKPAPKVGAISFSQNLGFIIILLVGVILTVIGIGLPQMRNLAGLGVATIFLSGAVRYYFTK